MISFNMIFLKYTLPVSILFSISLMAQDLNTLSKLEATVDESSGLIYLNGKVITHNDSGGEAALYEINEGNGRVTRKVMIVDAANRDWEDIDLDDTHIYIGDFGNNNGTRKDLRIYKIEQTDYLDSNSQANAQAIDFSYEDQTDFTSSPMATNFDAEGLIAYGDFLYVFTKNWVDNRTNIYRLPKTPGTHVAVRIDELDSNGLITGAAYNSLADRIVLVGYSGFSPFMLEISDFSGEKFSNGSIIRYELNVPGGNSFQVEAIAFTDLRRHLLSCEANILGDAALMEIVLSTLSVDDLDLNESIIYPNPAKENLWINIQSGLNRIQIYDYSGKLVLEKNAEFDSISLDELPKGHYLIRLYNDSGATVRKLIRE